MADPKRASPIPPMHLVQAGEPRSTSAPRLICPVRQNVRIRPLKAALPSKRRFGNCPYGQ
jgi:hypothetical protein